MGEPKYSIERIRGALCPLGPVAADGPECLDFYFDYYGLAPEKYIKGVDHSFGTFESAGYKLAAHVFVPEKVKGAVVGMHGYLNHCGQLRYLMRYLLERGYAVCAYDAPGHGLSSGKDAWIDDFDVYARILRDFKEVVSDLCPGPYHVAAFSFGSCPVIQTELEGNKLFEKTVLTAPLVRPIKWLHVRLSYRFYWPFRDSVSRGRPKNSDKEFIGTRNSDFLYRAKVPLMWVRGLNRWNRKIHRMGATEKEMLIIQGDKDNTVDWKYNTRFLAKKFETGLVMIDHGRHELFTEKDEIKSKVFSEIVNYLQR